MTTRRSLSRQLFCSLIVAGSSCARAHVDPTPPSSSAPTSLPVRLVDALFDRYGTPALVSDRFTVGALPPGYPAAFVPTGPASSAV
jgi:hypothetical protein